MTKKSSFKEMDLLFKYIEGKIKLNSLEVYLTKSKFNCKTIILKKGNKTIEFTHSKNGKGVSSFFVKFKFKVSGNLIREYETDGDNFNRLMQLVNQYDKLSMKNSLDLFIKN